MTKRSQADFTGKKVHSGATPKQISGTTSAAKNQGSGQDSAFPLVEPLSGTTQTTTTTTSIRDPPRTPFNPLQSVLEANFTKAPDAPDRNRDVLIETDTPVLEGVVPELEPSNFVSQNYEALAVLMREEAKKRPSRSMHARLDFGPESEISPPRRHKERRGKGNHRPPVFNRIGRRVEEDNTSDSQPMTESEEDGKRTSVHTRLGGRRVQDRLGERYSPSESPPSTNSEDNRRKRRRGEELSSSNSSDSEDSETGHWKSRRKNRDQEEEDMSLPWRRQKRRTCPRRSRSRIRTKKRRKSL